METCWLPFHEALAGQIEETLALFGTCLVIDCHSMPSLPGRHAPKADIILGDGYGTSCAPAWTDFLHATLAELGFQVRRNDPYAGGFITRHYGRPREGVQVIQLEMARGLYMNEHNFTRTPQFRRDAAAHDGAARRGDRGAGVGAFYPQTRRRGRGIKKRRKRAAEFREETFKSGRDSSTRFCRIRINRPGEARKKFCGAAMLVTYFSKNCLITMVCCGFAQARPDVT